MKINQKNIFGNNDVFSGNKTNILTRERIQGFSIGIIITIFTGTISGVIVEYVKNLLICK